jgi:hypothetical protein
MSSSIDILKPGEGRAYTADVRDNFRHARNEIQALQSWADFAGGRIDTLEALVGEGSQGEYLPISGGILTGDLTLAPATGGSFLTLDSTQTDAATSIFGQKNGINRWQSALGDSTDETGSNSGSNFILVAFADDGSVVGGDAVLRIIRATRAATFFGGLSVSGGSILAIGTNRIQAGQPGSANHITLIPGTPGTGVADITVGGIDGNVDMRLFATGAGQIRSMNHFIMNGVSNFTLAVDPTLPLHATTKQYVDSLIGEGSQGEYLPLAGGELTGDLTLTGVTRTLSINSGTGAPRIVLRGENTNRAIAPAISLYNPISDFGAGFTLPSGMLELGPAHVSGIVGPASTDMWMRFSATLVTVLRPFSIAIGQPATLGQDPTLPLHAATKQYVDANSGGGDNFLPLSGGTLSGGLSFGAASAGGPTLTRHITLHTDGYGFNVNTLSSALRYVVPAGAQHQFFIGTGAFYNFTGTEAEFGAPVFLNQGGRVSLGQSFTLGADPTQPFHAVTRQYVDDLVADLQAQINALTPQE